MSFRVFLVIAFVVCSAQQVCAERVQWSTAQGGNGHWYEPVQSLGIDWWTAKAAAEAAGGYLATLTSRQEDEYVYSLIANDPLMWKYDGVISWHGPWIGGYQLLNSEEPAGGWQWVTGENWEYTNWLLYEPNNAVGGTEDRLQYFGRYEKSDTWNDMVAHGFYVNPGYIIEMDTYVVPEPVTLAGLFCGLAGLGAYVRRRCAA